MSSIDLSPLARQTPESGSLSSDDCIDVLERRYNTGYQDGTSASTSRPNFDIPKVHDRDVSGSSCDDDGSGDQEDPPQADDEDDQGNPLSPPDRIDLEDSYGPGLGHRILLFVRVFLY